MKLYIPEIGDVLRLSSDWTFDLHAENRNVALGLLHGYYYTYRSGWIQSSKLQPMREIPAVVYPDRDDPAFKNFFGKFDWQAYDNACRKTNDESPEVIQWRADWNEWLVKADSCGVSKFSVTIPAGTTLKVDRIYIRKGASDYSSITFFAEGLGEVEVTQGWSNKKKVKKKALRFWAKLSDCNEIEIEKI
jgi:hypothetical protein